jgi:hypothetical protein
VDVSADLQELVDRRGALRARMLALRAESPDDHDGFLRTVDQLLAVSNRIVEIVSAPPEAPSAEAESPDTPAAAVGDGHPSAVEGGADQGSAGGPEDHAG